MGLKRNVYMISYLKYILHQKPTTAKVIVNLLKTSLKENEMDKIIYLRISINHQTYHRCFQHIVNE